MHIIKMDPRMGIGINTQYSCSLDRALVFRDCWKASAPLPAEVSAGGRLSSPHTHTHTTVVPTVACPFVHSLS